MPGENSPVPVVGAIVLAAVSTVFPGFVIGAMSVQVSAEFDIGEATYGWALGSFFLGATAGSVGLGRLAQRIGARRQIVGVLAVSAVVQLVLAGFATSFVHIVLTLAICGVANAANQTAINLALTEARLPRLGLTMAVKQSSMPGAALLSGLAVPAVALTVGWRWAYVVGAILSAVAMVMVRWALPAGAPSSSDADRPRPRSARADLIGVAIGGGFLAFSAGSLSAWLVGSGVDAGLDPGVAGAMLSVGAGCGIALRLAWGFRLDTSSVAPLRLAGIMVLVGAAGFALLALRTPGWHVAATVMAFGAGWIWPIFTNYGVVRSNPEAAATATGITQTGVYVGVFAAPLLTGWLIEAGGYSVMWTVVSASAIVGGLVLIRVSPRF